MGVVLMHMMFTAASGGNGFANIAQTYLPYLGNLGVDVFFVVSGFIIYLQLDRGEAAGAFAVRRAFRIYPLLWLTVSAMIGLRWWIGAHNTGWDDILAHPLQLLLIDYPHVLDVSWTLPFEGYFYVAASLALLAGARAEEAIWGWVALQAVLVGAMSASAIPYAEVLQPLSLEFALGLAIGRLVIRSRYRLPAPALFIALGLALPAAACAFIGWQALYTSPFGRLLICGVSASLIVLGILSLEARGWRPHRSMTLLGDISYSLYMWHSLVFLGLGFIMGDAVLHRTAGMIGFCLGSLALTLLISWLSFQFIEQPINRWAHQRTSRLQFGVKEQVVAAVEHDHVGRGQA